jgi:hypothetical protein
MLKMHPQRKTTSSRGLLHLIKVGDIAKIQGQIWLLLGHRPLISEMPPHWGLTLPKFRRNQEESFVVFTTVAGVRAGSFSCEVHTKVQFFFK